MALAFYCEVFSCLYNSLCLFYTVYLVGVIGSLPEYSSFKSNKGVILTLLLHKFPRAYAIISYI